MKSIRVCFHEKCCCKSWPVSKTRLNHGKKGIFKVLRKNSGVNFAHKEANLNFITRWNNNDRHLEILGFESRKSSVETSRLPSVRWIYLMFAAAISNFSILKIELDGKPTPLWLSSYIVQPEKRRLCCSTLIISGVDLHPHNDRHDLNFDLRRERQRFGWSRLYITSSTLAITLVEVSF